MLPSRVFRPALSPFRPTHPKRMERLHGIRPPLSWLRSTPAAKQGSGTATRTPPLPSIVNGALAEAAADLDALQIPLAHEVMLRRVRNIGRPGLVATAIAAVDSALWDLKGKLLDLPVVSLLGAARDAVPVYGSGGFTTYSIGRLKEQLGGWASQGMRWVKMKVGTDPALDLDRVRAARSAIGKAGLFVDANGAYSRKEALSFAEGFASLGVVYFEEPVSSDDLEGLRLIRDRGAGWDEDRGGGIWL